MRKWILASASPRRKELLFRLGVTFQVIPSKAEEVITQSDPKEAVKHLAMLKAREVSERQMQSQACLQEGKGDTIVLGADTVVVYEEKILGKPKDKKDAAEMLQMLSGQTHQVYTGVSLMRLPMGQVYTFCQRTDVTMYPLSEEEIRRYVDTGEPMDKAGSYGIQGLGGIFVKKISGDYNNVVGLPISRIWHDLAVLDRRDWRVTPELIRDLERENTI